MKLLLDFFPIVLFFLTYKFGSALPFENTWLKEHPLYLATLVAMVSSLVQLAINWFVNRKIETMHLVSSVLLIVMGSATWLLDDPNFIKWKPTVVNWLFGLAFLFTQLFTQRTAIERMMGSQLELPPNVWRKLNLAWASFFIVTGTVNLYVAYTFEEAVWVDFKMFGLLGLTIAFVVVQTLFLSRYLPEHKLSEPNIEEE